jgi:demethoxyubiquinone hydroxylase (CLK1/Coq7/Cat5 family)
MYKNYLDYQEKEIKRTFRAFMEIEMAHINKLEIVLRNLGAQPSLLIEGGDIIGRMLGITINLTDIKTIVKTYSFIEEKSHIGYTKFINKLEQDDEKRTQFIAEFLASNMLEAKLMQLWLEDHLKTY